MIRHWGNSRGSRTRGVGTPEILAIAVVVFIVGTSAGIVLNSTVLDSNGSELSENMDRIEVLESRVENLREDLVSVRDSLEDKNAWTVPQVYESIRPSVVKIIVGVEQQEYFGSSMDWGYGSGFVYNGDNGLILTNEHVISNADEIYVRLHTGKTLKASVVGTDRRTDIAILDIETDQISYDLEALDWENSSTIGPGERVMAMGSPFGLTGSVTAGVVSQVDRTLSASETGRSYPFVGLIQTDAVINPGSSGGPLLTFSGDVAGVNSYIQSQNRQYSGVGYAISSNLAKKVANGLVENGEYYHPWIGISGNSTVEEPVGLEVTRVFGGSPADESELQEGDVITEIEGKEVMSISEIYSYIVVNKRPGEEITLSVVRDGETLSISITLGRRN